MLEGSAITPRAWETPKDAYSRVRDTVRHQAVKVEKFTADDGPLSYGGYNDYTLKSERDSVWIEVTDQHAVNIRRNSGVVSVEIYTLDGHGELGSVADCTVELT